jgi:anti-sigma B factor antagonist
MHDLISAAPGNLRRTGQMEPSRAAREAVPAPWAGPARRARGRTTPMPDVRFPVQAASGVPVVTAPGQIDITNAAGLRAALLHAAADGHGTFVVDMTGTRFCDSAGLHVLAGAHNRARAEGGQVLLVIAGAAVLRIFAVTGLDRVIPNFTSLAEALAQTPGDGDPSGHPVSRTGR